MRKLFRVTTVPVSIYLLLKNQLRFMSDYFDVTAVSSEGIMLQKVASREGVSTIPVNMTRKISPLRDLISLYKLFYLFKKERPEIVHTLSPKAGLLGMMAAKLAGVPIRMHSVAGLPLLETLGVKRVLLDAMEKLTCSCATRVYSNSFKLRSVILKNKYCKENKLTVIGNGSTNGIDTAHFDPSLFNASSKKNMRTSLNIGSDDIVFCFVGRIVKPKGIVELLKAFTLLSEINSNVRLLFVGPFDADKDSLDPETISEITSHSCIRWVGFQEDVRPYLSVSDVFVFPSHREGFPNVVMQACAMQLPCIVTDINGSNELIEHGINGLIVQVKDDKSLYDAMQQLVTENSLRISMAMNSRHNIVARYDQRFVFNSILREYHQALSAASIQPIDNSQVSGKSPKQDEHRYTTIQH
ncbi:MAG: glycosyltransferase family 4 protein [Flavitalea sp.]